VLGDPCRTEEDATVPSRIADDFELKLSIEPPEQLEEEAVQRFGDLLRSFVIAESASPFLDQAAVEDLVRGLLPGSPPLAPPASPPEPLYLPADQAAEILTAAWQVWVTEVRPQIAGGAEGCAGGGESCVALGRLEMIVQDNDGNLEVASADPDVSERPFLLHTRVIQEWLTLALRPPRHGDLLGLDDDDHLQYLLVDPDDRSLIADLDANGHRVVGLPAALANGQAVPYEQAVKVGDPAGGDLAGTYRDPQVVKLQGRAILDTPPAPGAVLVWNGSQWIPKGAVMDGDPASGDLIGNYPGPAVARLRGRSVSSAAPANGNVLTWNDVSKLWEPQAPTGGGGGVPDLVEEDLTRIVALSWSHGPQLGYGPLDFDGLKVDGVALSFGKVESNLPQPMQPGTLNTESIRVWARLPTVDEIAGVTLPFFSHLQVPVEILYGDVDKIDEDGRISSVVSVSQEGPSAVVLVFDPDAVGYLQERAPVLIRVEVLGDRLRDMNDQAPDVRFLTLPTGPLPERLYGIQGGYFESWFPFIEVPAGSFLVGDKEVATAGAAGDSLSIAEVDLNRATAKDLQTLPGVGPALAKRIVAERKKGGEFTSLEDLRRVSGISEKLIDRLREQQDGES
jgi:competence ComEA-like helix-hairpin-helix protein